MDAWPQSFQASDIIIPKWLPSSFVGRMVLLRSTMKVAPEKHHLTYLIEMLNHIDGLVQDCSNSIANALELLQPCTKPSISSCIPLHQGDIPHRSLQIIHQIQTHINSLGPCDAIWHHRTFLLTPSHYLNQCSLINSAILWHSPDGNFTENAWEIYAWYEFENDQFKIITKCHKPMRPYSFVRNKIDIHWVLSQDDRNKILNPWKETKGAN